MGRAPRPHRRPRRGSLRPLYLFFFFHSYVVPPPDPNLSCHLQEIGEEDAKAPSSPSPRKKDKGLLGIRLFCIVVVAIVHISSFPSYFPSYPHPPPPSRCVYCCVFSHRLIVVFVTFCPSPRARSALRPLLLARRAGAARRCCSRSSRFAAAGPSSRRVGGGGGCGFLA